MTTTTVIGDVTRKVSGPVNQPPPGKPPNTNPGGGKPGGGGGIGASAFETAIGTESPLVWYTFRDNHFKQRVRDRAGSRHLDKQIAEATRSSVPTRTTHPGGALFDAITSANWATQGQFYKGPTGVLNGASAYTILVSMRMVANTSGEHYFAGIGTENVINNGSNELVGLHRGTSTTETIRHWHRTGSSNDVLQSAVTGRVEDGVNRLYTIRSTGSSSQILKISKPGATYVTEDTASQGALAAVDRALLLNAQDNTTNDPSAQFVIDQWVIWDSDIGATAEENLHDLWTAELGGYYPSMMEFTTSSSYYGGTYTSSGNKVTLVARFNSGTFTGVNSGICASRGPNVRQRGALRIYASDNADSEIRNLLSFGVNNSANTEVCKLFSDAVMTDGEDHTVFAEFDGDAGTAVFVIDGVAHDASVTARVAPTTATLDAGASSTFAVGASTAAGGEAKIVKVGFCGHAEVIGLDPDDFMSSNLPLPIDEVNWTEWGAQPLFWSHSGEMTNNKGSAGDMTANGTITMTTGGSP